MPPSCFLHSNSSSTSASPHRRPPSLPCSLHSVSSRCPLSASSVASLCLFCLSLLLIPNLTSAQSTSSTGNGGIIGSSTSSSNPVVPPISLSTAFLRILGALGLGGLIGLEREITNITRRLRGMAGIRTHAVICTGSCLIQLVSVYAYADVSGYGMNRDPSRLAAQAVSGIGFVGAGAILKGGENVIYGLTSAASIWLVMAVGLAVGVGYWAVTTVTVVLVVFAMVVTKRVEHFVFGRRYGPGYTAEMEVVSKSGPNVLQHILDCIGQQLNIATISMERTQHQHTPRPTNATHHNPPTASPTTTPLPSPPPTAPPPASAEPPPQPALPPPTECLRVKFVVRLDDCDRALFLLHVQCVVLLLCEDGEVYKVESRNVQEVRDGPSHRLEWTVPSRRETQQAERRMEQLKQEVRQRRTAQKRKMAGASETDAEAKNESGVHVDVGQSAVLRPTAVSRGSSSDTD